MIQINSCKKRDHENLLKMNKRLPKIVLPKSKLKLFDEWWDSDIKHENSIPHSFEEGYLIIELGQIARTEEERVALIKQTAKQFHQTFRQIENELKAFDNELEKITLYFKFINENTLYIDTYDYFGVKLSHMDVEVGENGYDDIDVELARTFDFQENEETQENYYSRLLNYFNIKNLVYLATCLWYMATTATNTNYIYEETHQVITGRHKGVVQVSDTKYIRTPVYDMSKIKTVRVEKLIARKKGWTYSHSFQVHGHYRHYKNGNVIFINSFVKGKGKPFKAQEIILEPDVIKE